MNAPVRNLHGVMPVMRREAPKWSPRRMIFVAFWVSLGLWLLLGNVARAIWLAVS